MLRPGPPLSLGEERGPRRSRVRRRCATRAHPEPRAPSALIPRPREAPAASEVRLLPAPATQHEQGTSSCGTTRVLTPSVTSSARPATAAPANARSDRRPDAEPPPASAASRGEWATRSTARVALEDRPPAIAGAIRASGGAALLASLARTGRGDHRGHPGEWARRGTAGLALATGRPASAEATRPSGPRRSTARLAQARTGRRHRRGHPGERARRRIARPAQARTGRRPPSRPPGERARRRIARPAQARTGRRRNAEATPMSSSAGAVRVVSAAPPPRRLGLDRLQCRCRTGERA
jgi:hypothetical protein